MITERTRTTAFALLFWVLFVPVCTAFAGNPAPDENVLKKPAAEKLVQTSFFRVFGGLQRDNLYTLDNRDWWQIGSEKFLKKGSNVSIHITAIDGAGFFLNADGYGRTQVKPVTILYTDRIKSASRGLAKDSVIELNNGLKWKVAESEDAVKNGKTVSGGEQVVMTYDDEVKCNRLFAAVDTWQVRVEIYTEP